jgi:tripartite-type tricarboxylate transporter receptor subunit TctC
VLGGHVPVAVTDLPSAQQHILDGKLLGLAISSSKRVPTLPNVPTVAELGFAGYEAVGWFGLVVPKDTPPHIIARLNSAFTKGLRDPAIIKTMTDLGNDPEPTTPEGFAQYIRSEHAKWGKVVAEAGVKE